jgi:ABC-2 type transport system ATP-binding protein
MSNPEPIDNASFDKKLPDFRSAGVSPAEQPQSAGVSPAGESRSAGVSPAEESRSAGVSPAEESRSAGVSPAQKDTDKTPTQKPAGGTPALQDNQAAIKLYGLTKRFGRSVAVNNLSLTVPRGSTFGLLGPNGAGKSTTIKMLMGMLSITAGKALVLGVDVQDDPVQVKQRVGYVPEIHNIYRWMRVREVIGFCKSCFPTWNDKLCREMLTLFGLDPAKKVKHLSKGMQVKLSLLTAVSHEPELLLLDEPLSGLDPIAREEFLDGVLRTICDRGQTVLISSHMLDDVRRLADTIGILNNGRLIVQGNVDQLLTSTKRICATLRDGAKPAQIPDGVVWQRVEGREWTITVRDFSPEKVRQVQSLAGVENARVVDLGLEDLFKDFIRGQKVAQ